MAQVLQEVGGELEMEAERVLTATLAVSCTWANQATFSSTIRVWMV
jgi:hypothetical protein